MNVFFDVDHTIIDADDGLRPGVRELFARLRADGHRVYLWSGLGARWEVVERHELAELVSGCFPKPLYAYERMLAPLGIDVRPDFAVDDHPHLVHAFGGCVVAPYRGPALYRSARSDQGVGGLSRAPGAPDAEMERVYHEIQRAADRATMRSRRIRGGSA